MSDDNLFSRLCNQCVFSPVHFTAPDFTSKDFLLLNSLLIYMLSGVVMQLSISLSHPHDYVALYMGYKKID